MSTSEGEFEVVYLNRDANCAVSNSVTCVTCIVTVLHHTTHITSIVQDCKTAKDGRQADLLFQLSAALRGFSDGPMVSWSLAFLPWLYCALIQNIAWHWFAVNFITL